MAISGDPEKPRVILEGTLPYLGGGSWNVDWLNKNWKYCSILGST